MILPSHIKKIIISRNKKVSLTLSVYVNFRKMFLLFVQGVFIKGNSCIETLSCALDHVCYDFTNMWMHLIWICDLKMWALVIWPVFKAPNHGKINPYISIFKVQCHWDDKQNMWYFFYLLTLAVIWNELTLVQHVTFFMKLTYWHPMENSFNYWNKTMIFQMWLRMFIRTTLQQNI